MFSNSANSFKQQVRHSQGRIVSRGCFASVEVQSVGLQCPRWKLLPSQQCSGVTTACSWVTANGDENIRAVLLHHTFCSPAVSQSEANTQRQGAWQLYGCMASKAVFGIYNSFHHAALPPQPQESLRALFISASKKNVSRFLRLLSILLPLLAFLSVSKILIRGRRQLRFTLLPEWQHIFSPYKVLEIPEHL